eukprot:5693418-Pyramimonas_sp.AAC.1
MPLAHAPDTVTGWAEGHYSIMSATVPRGTSWSVLTSFESGVLSCTIECQTGPDPNLQEIPQGLPRIPADLLGFLAGLLPRPDGSKTAEEGLKRVPK